MRRITFFVSRLLIIPVLFYTLVWSERSLAQNLSDDDLHMYVAEDEVMLKPYIVDLLRTYFGNRKNWIPFSVGLNSIISHPDVRIIALGTSHGKNLTGTQKISTEIVAYLKLIGFSAVFIELDNEKQTYIDSFLRLEIDYDELVSIIPDIDNEPGRGVMEISRDLGLTVVAMDIHKMTEAKEREVFMCKTVMAYLSKNPDTKVVLIAGAHHTAQSWYYNLDHIKPLTALLRHQYGNTAVSSIYILPRYNDAIVDTVFDQVPYGMMVRTSTTLINRVPSWFDSNYQLRYPNWEHIMRYGDWDYFAYELKTDNEGK